MTQKQLDHYLKGGMFNATYSPQYTGDLDPDNLRRIGERVTIFQNMLNSPIISPEKWKGQFRFNSYSVHGWFPEEDVKDLEMLDEYLDEVEPTTKHLYMLHYDTEKQVKKNFGKFTQLEPPVTIAREFSLERDAYVIGLSFPQATWIKKAIWNGEGKFENLKWEDLL